MAQESKIQVDNIESLTTARVELPFGATLPSGSSLVVNGDFNAGVVTATTHGGENANFTGVCTATSFVGNGSALTNLPIITEGKSIAYTLIAG
jgi:hypothetical protein|tara:strand:+ start:980 stop:1258 length:279 start_codon:yes stop_codon:yes gene_type:complete